MTALEWKGWAPPLNIGHKSETIKYLGNIALQLITTANGRCFNGEAFWGYVHWIGFGFIHRMPPKKVKRRLGMLRLKSEHTKLRKLVCIVYWWANHISSFTAIFFPRSGCYAHLLIRGCEDLIGKFYVLLYRCRASSEGLNLDFQQHLMPGYTHCQSVRT